MDGKKKITIDITPTWTAAMQIYFAVLETQHLKKSAHVVNYDSITGESFLTSFKEEVLRLSRSVDELKEAIPEEDTNNE